MNKDKWKKINKLFKTLTKKSQENLLNETLDYFQDTNAQSYKPKTKKNNIGIEIECFGKIDMVDLLILIDKKRLSNYIAVGHDGSITSIPGTHPYELKLLIPEYKLVTILPKIERLLKEAKLRVNKTCGLHVHLDMRNRNFNSCYNKLEKFKDVLFSLVKKDRWNNDYCRYNYDGRHSAINKFAYKKHKTIEVRLHHSTLDMKLVRDWINFLIKIISVKAVPTVKNKAALLKWKMLDNTNKSYIKRTMTDDWFNRPIITNQNVYINEFFEYRED